MPSAVVLNAEEERLEDDIVVGGLLPDAIPDFTLGVACMIYNHHYCGAIASRHCTSIHFLSTIFCSSPIYEFVMFEGPFMVARVRELLDLDTWEFRRCGHSVEHRLAFSCVGHNALPHLHVDVMTVNSWSLARSEWPPWATTGAKSTRLYACLCEQHGATSRVATRQVSYIRRDKIYRDQPSCGALEIAGTGQEGSSRDADEDERKTGRRKNELCRSSHDGERSCER